MSDAVQSRLGFRADINGLRAFAVLAVLAYHFGVPPFASGFTGVDVFFVISGYLMTGIILGRLGKGSFSVPGFYLDRARRIIPALLVLIAAVLALGYAILLGDEYILLSKDAASSALFASNLLYWMSSGYFDAGVEQKWLLHTWSLSVEWQFYLLYPLLLVALVRFAPRRRLAAILAGLALLSFALTVALSRTDANAGFFLLPPRAWEMLAGGLVFLAPPLDGRTARAAQLGGLALIAASAVALRSPGWPNGWTLVPVLGTALVILAGRTGSRITGNPAMAWIGLNSYSIYLWHWPVAVLLKRSAHVGDPLWIAGALALSFLLGHLSWRFVEPIARPRTDRPHIHTAAIRFDWRAHLAFAVAVVLVVGASAAVWKLRGLPQRFSPEVQAAAAAAAPTVVPGAMPCFGRGYGMPEPCVLGPATSPLLATMIGDSHADSQLAGFLAAVPPGRRGGVGFQAYASCPPILGVGLANPNGSRCQAFVERYLTPFTRPHAEPLVLVGSWVTYIEEPKLRFAGHSNTAGGKEFLANLVSSSCKLAAAGPTYIVLPTPQFDFGVAETLQYRMIADPDAPDIAIPLADHLRRQAEVIAALRTAERSCGVRLLDPTPYLCPAGRCMGSIRHRATVRDRSHLTDLGSSLLTPMFAPVFAVGTTP
jgi:peptidoglycan/LPS O-acetylase OafA/YrhL